MAEGMMSPSDVAVMMANKGNTDGWGDGMGFMWIFALLILANGGFGGWGGNNAAAAALGYENLATSSEVQRGFDAQNSMANEREILAAVNAVGAQGIQAGYQNVQYLTGMINDKYGELARDISGLAMQAQALQASQQQCCCETKMLIAETAANQRYESAMQNNAAIQAIRDEGAATRAMIQQDKYEQLQQKYNDLNTAFQLAGVIRYPMSTTYNAGWNPYCNCGGMVA